MSKNATRQVSIYINGKEVENTFAGIETAVRKTKNELRRLVIGSEEYTKKAKELDRLNGLINEHRSALTGTQKGWSVMNAGLSSFAGMAAGAFAVENVIAFGVELFNTGAKMEALDRKFKTVFGETLPAVTAMAEKHALAMGMTTHQYLEAAAAAQDLLVPLGFTRNEAANLSARLVNLSGALSEWTGGQISSTQVTEILNSALLGEREALKSLGIDLQEADIKAEMMRRGFESLTGDVRKQAEAVVSLDLIMQKSTDAQTAFATGQDTMARKTAMLNARFEELKEYMAHALIPIFNDALKVATDFFAVASGEGVDYTQSASIIAKRAAAFMPSGLQAPFMAIGTALGNKPAAANVGAPADTGPALTAEEQAAQAKRFADEERKQKQKDKAEKARKKQEAKRERERERAEEEAEERAQDQRESEAQARAFGDRLRATQGAFDRIAEINRLAHEQAMETNAANSQAEFEQMAATQLQKEQFELDYAAEKAAAQEQVTLATLTDHEMELLQLESHYQRLLMVAERYGIDTNELTRQHLEEKARIETEYQTEKAEKEAEIVQARYVAMANDFAALGEITTAAFDLLGSETENAADLQKIAALAQIAFDTASAISSLTAKSQANPANAVTFGGAGIAQYASGIVKILAAMGQARKALKSAPAVKQRYMGGPLEVTGASDGRTYRPGLLAGPNTGLLPSGPQMFASMATGAPVLANERGREFFVSAEDMRDPYVANLTRMIQLASNGRGPSVSQFADGGMNPPQSDQPGMGQLAPVLNQMLALLGQLNANGVQAVIGDRQLVEGQKQLNRLNKVSGGYLPN